jgi:amino acid adenylation domain-containing protein/thioester reductase-like protein
MSFKVKLFETAKQNLNQAAVTSHGGSYTYKDLICFAKALEPKLNDVKRIGLFFEKSKEYIASLFAVSVSEAAFVPLELSSPEERLNYIINDSEIEIILTSKKYKNSDLDKLPKTVEVIFFEDILGLTNEETNRPTEEVKDEPAYVIYTSGSTGNPKGVEVSNNGLLNVIEQQIEITKMDKSKFYLYLAISFDASLSDIYCSLLSASHIYIYDCLRRNAIGLKDYFNDVGITHSDLPPSFLKLLSPSDFKTLKSIIIGGEVADYKSVQEFAKELNVVNVYGPTEATICTSMIVCDETWSKPLIGHALKNVGYRILDEENNEITSDMIGVTGELIITGCQLANGYLNNPEMNAKTFVELENKEGVKERSYKTGDYVCYNEDGLIEFKGRVDRQIKYHGQLINLEEVESAINSIQEVKSVTVIFKNKKMYAYYEGDIKDTEIRTELKTKVPVYMIPSFIINKDIPKTVTGKNDGKLLSKQDSSSDEELVIANLFKSILEIEEDIVINPELSFIKDLSGDSLDFVQLHLALQQMGMNIQYDYLIENNSIKDILNYDNKEIVIDTEFLVKESEKLTMPEIKPTQKQKEEIVFLTGSTGLLGSAILNGLMKKEEVKEIYCLVRGVNERQAKEKILATLERNEYVYPKVYFSKVKVVLGDVSKEKLSIKEDIYQELIEKVDTVYHCAAEVNNIKTFNQMYESNVLSTVNMVDFVFSGRDKTLHYASTLSVYVSSDKLDNSVFGEERLENDGHRLYSGYAQTKWLSEYYLNNIQEKTDNIFIYRFGLLTAPVTKPHLRGTGFLNQAIKDIKEIKSIPRSEVNLSMDLTPLDLAEIVVRNIAKQKEKGDIFNISFNVQMTLESMAHSLGVNKQIDLEDWFAEYGHYSIAQYMTDINNAYTKQHNMNLFETTNIKKFKCENACDIIDSIMIDFDYYIFRMVNGLENKKTFIVANDIEI